MYNNICSDQSLPQEYQFVLPRSEMHPMLFTLQPPLSGDPTQKPTGIVHAEHSKDETMYSSLGFSQTQREEMICNSFSGQNTI